MSPKSKVFDDFLELGLWGDLGGIDANARSIRAPKKVGATLFLHMSSEILKIASVEVEQSEKHQKYR